MSEVGRVDLFDGYGLAVGESAADDGGDKDEFGEGGERIREAEGRSGSRSRWWRVREKNLRVRGSTKDSGRGHGGCSGNRRSGSRRRHDIGQVGCQGGLSSLEVFFRAREACSDLLH